MDRTRLWIAAMICPMGNAVLFGAGAMLVLGLPFLRANATWSLPVVGVPALVWWRRSPVSSRLRSRSRDWGVPAVGRC
ncbi:MAG: hypothetical protein KKH72_07355 [Alphaproteobacteria bacterium]|nr:hypothetical protein [Alphaproteobacteria bacterium]